jgi:phosphate/sulfate permease
METNIGIALFTAATSVGVGGLVSYILYVKTIGKWYSKEKRESKHVKIKYWCGILSLLTITQGVTTIVSALINSLINNVAINVDSVAKGLVVVIIYPILFAVVAFGLVFLTKEKTNKESIQVEEIIEKI